MDHPATACRAATAETLARLVGFDTTNPNSNLSLINFMRNYPDMHAVGCRVRTDETGRKANIHPIIGPQQASGVALSGHVDTVPVDGQEAGCDGARRLILDLPDSPRKPGLCVVGEPSGMQPILARKDKLNLPVTLRGLPGHASEPVKAVNVIHAAGEAIARVAAEARRFARQGLFEDGFAPPATTIRVGTLVDGTDIIPVRAAFVMDWSYIPGGDSHRLVDRPRAFVAEHIKPDMHAGHPATDVEFEVPVEMPGSKLGPGHGLTAIVKHPTGSNNSGKVTYGTDGGSDHEADIPTMICGPGDIAQARQPDGFVARSELDTCDSFIRRPADRLLM